MTNCTIAQHDERVGQTLVDEASSVSGSAQDQSSGLSVVDLNVLEDRPPLLSKLYELFRRTTGLELFLFFKNSVTGKWQEKPIISTFCFPRFCQLVRSSPVGAERCFGCHQNMLTQANRFPGVFYGQCHAGLTSLHYPISLLREGPASIQTICTLERKQKARDFLLIHKKIAGLGLDEKNVLDVIDELQALSEPDLSCVSEWLGIFADYLCDLSKQGCSNFEDIEPQVLPQFDVSPSPEDRIRFEIGKYVALPERGEKRNSGVSPTLINCVVKFLTQYYYYPLSTQVVASSLGFEPGYFARAFKRHVHGMSMTAYLKNTRLEQAKKLLANSYLPVEKVAERSGFSDPSYFARVFRSAVGTSPNEFRKSSMNQPGFKSAGIENLVLSCTSHTAASV